jgi:hypothetical protein
VYLHRRSLLFALLLVDETAACRCTPRIRDPLYIAVSALSDIATN